MKKLNESQIIQKWTPVLESTLNVKGAERLSWMSVYAQNHALNEAEMGGVSSPYATLYNTPGVGNAVPASFAAQTGGQQQSAAAKGSGDKWPSLLPLALQVAAKTVGFDVVNVVPMSGPTGVIPYLDYIYAGGKEPFGAAPAYSKATANPSDVLATAEAQYMFKAAIDRTITSSLVGGTAYTISQMSGDTAVAAVVTNFVGVARIFGYPIFKVTSITASKTLADVFDVASGNTLVITGGALPSGGTEITTAPQPQSVSMLEDQVQGFAGSGSKDATAWSGTFVNPQVLYDAMDRGTGENQYPRQLALKAFTKFVQVGTFQVSVNVTQEQIQDLNKQWGIDVIAMVENAGVNEISQSINKTILSRLFGMGWLNHTQAQGAEQINLNLNLTSATGVTHTAAVPFDNEAGYKLETMDVKNLQTYGTNNFENQDTIIKRIMAAVMAAGNVVAQRGRRGPANFIVTNLKIATALQTNSQYSFAPVQNSLNQANGSLYPLGDIAGMRVYVDPNMAYEDTRILVGRKGEKDEPGVVFCPYLLAEKVQLISEGTGAPKVIIKSRYALVDTGFHPQTMYLTVYVKTNSGALI